MEQQSEILQKVSQNFLSKLTKQNLVTITQYLDDDTIQFLLKITNYQNKNSNKVTLLQTIFTKNYIRKYLNCTDRSAYIWFYSQSKFSQIQSNYIKKILLNESQRFKNINRKLESIKQQMINNFQKVIDPSLIIQHIFMTLKDPVFPNLRLKKGNIGMYCNSGFQFYLTQKCFKLVQKQQLQQAFDELKKKLIELRNTDKTTQQSYQNQNIDECRDKIQMLSQNWHQLTSQNYQIYIIKNNNKLFVPIIHNFIVFLVAIIDCHVQSIDIYLQYLAQDIFHQFFQFNLRFSIFRNTCLELLTQTQFLFNFYLEIANNLSLNLSLNKEQKRIGQGFSMINCFIFKWYARMNKRHNQFNQTYCCLLKKINFNKFLKNLYQNTLNQQYFQIYLQNDISKLEQDIMGIKCLYWQSPIYQYMQECENVYQVLKQYIQYHVDISINQKSVHWCGHSSQELLIPYQKFQQTVRDSLKQYFQRIYHICIKIDQTGTLFKQVINRMILQLDHQQLKPVTLKKIINDLNSKFGNIYNKIQQADKLTFDKLVNYRDCTKEENICIQDKNKMEEKDAYEGIDFKQKDGRLEHLNGQMGILFEFDSNTSLFQQSEDLNNSLKKTAQTKCSKGAVQQQMDIFFSRVMHKTISLQR